MKNKCGSVIVSLLFCSSLLFATHLRSIAFGFVFEMTFLIILVFARKSIHLREFDLIIVFIASYFTFFALIGYLNPGMGEVDLKYSVILIYGLLAFILLSISKENIYKGLLYYSYSSAVISFVVLLSFVLYYSGIDYLSNMLYIRSGNARAAGLLGGPNYFAISSAFAFFVSYYIWRFNSGSGWPVIFILLGTLASLSRGVILGLFVFFICVFIMDRVARKKIIITAVAASAVIPFLYLTFNERILRLQSTLIARFSDHGGGASTRFDLFNTTLQSLDTVDWILGSGRYDYSSAGMAYSPHNLYISTIADQGLFGLLGYFFLFLIILFFSFSLRKHYKSFPVAVLLFCIMAALTNDYQYVREWWLIMALAAYFINIKRNQARAISVFS